MFGNVATWFSSALSFGAVLVAYIAILRQQRQFDSAAYRARETELASVFAWFEKAPDHAGRIDWILRIENKTAVPVYTWAVKIDSGTLHLSWDADAYGPAIPGENRFPLADSGALEGLDGLTSNQGVSFVFVDSEGQQRVRNNRGELVNA